MKLELLLLGLALLWLPEWALGGVVWQGKQWRAQMKTALANERAKRKGGGR